MSALDFHAHDHFDICHLVTFSFGTEPAPPFAGAHSMVPSPVALSKATLVPSANSRAGAPYMCVCGTAGICISRLAGSGVHLSSFPPTPQGPHFLHIVKRGAKHFLNLSVIRNQEVLGQALADRPTRKRRSTRQTDEFNSEGKAGPLDEGEGLGSETPINWTPRAKAVCDGPLIGHRNDLLVFTSRYLFGTFATS